ncbi:armadillo/beta-catenin-like repeat-containing protein [Ensifer sp. NM-2]|uniref:armadillo/beta-catenin-like repeat-containing protein n=1 Tax=Ensifer sp. NM-2 TaxID=2109730 RepID=UPI00352A6B98
MSGAISALIDLLSNSSPSISATCCRAIWGRPCAPTVRSPAISAPSCRRRWSWGPSHSSSRSVWECRSVCCRRSTRMVRSTRLRARSRSAAFRCRCSGSVLS